VAEIFRQEFCKQIINLVPGKLGEKLFENSTVIKQLTNDIPFAYI